MFLCLLRMVCKLLLLWPCETHWEKRVIFRLQTDRNNTFFHPIKKEKEWGFFLCVNLDRSSFRGESLDLRWVLTGGTASCRGLHPPWSQPAQEASLSSLHPSWKLLLISKCHKFHSPLSLGALAKGGEHRGGEKGKKMAHSFFLSFSLSSEEKAWCWHSTQSAVSQIPFPISSWSSTRNSSSGRNKQAVDVPKGSPFCWCLMERMLFQQAFTLVLFVERGAPKLSLHPTALSPLC